MTRTGGAHAASIQADTHTRSHNIIMKVLVSLGDNTVATVIGQQFVSKEAYQAELIGGLCGELAMYLLPACNAQVSNFVLNEASQAVPIAEVYHVVSDRACCESAACPGWG